MRFVDNVSVAFHLLLCVCSSKLLLPFIHLPSSTLSYINRAIVATTPTTTTIHLENTKIETKLALSADRLEPKPWVCSISLNGIIMEGRGGGGIHHKYRFTIFV